MSLSRRQRDRVESLDRRRAELDRRLEVWAGGDPSRSRAERGALVWALGIVYAAADSGILFDLEQRAGVR